MLPSFRTLAATFLCGFIFVFASLQVATTLNSKHMALPVTAARAAPTPAVPDPDWPKVPAAAPALYDLRFIASATAPTPASLRPQQIDRLAPLPVPIVAREAVQEPPPIPVATEIEPIDASEIVAATPAAPLVTQSTAPQPTVEPTAKLDTQPVTVAAIEPLPAPGPDARISKISSVATSDDSITEPPPTPQADTVAAAPSDTEKSNDTAIAPPPPKALEVASLAPATSAAEIEAPNPEASVPVTVTIVLPKSRPTGEVLQAKRSAPTKKRATRTQWSAQRDSFNNGPFGGGFDNWQRQHH